MEEQVLEILVDVCKDDIVKEDKDVNLFDTGLLDSLGVIELLVEIEEKLSISIEPTEVERSQIGTPNKIIEYINKRK